MLPNQPQQCTGDALLWPRAARASFLAAMRIGLAFLLLLGSRAQLEIRVDDRTVIYNGGANYTASLQFCDQHNIPDADACAWDIYQTSGATNGQLIQEAWALLPDAYVDVKQARATVSELQRRVSSLTPFALDDSSVPVLQPHWRLAFSGGTGTEISSILRGWGRLYSEALFHALAEPRIRRSRPRVGFASSWFCNSAIGRLYTGLLEKINWVDVYVFHVREPSGRLKRDFFTDAIDAVSTSHVLPRDLSEARAIIASSNLDILVFTDIGMEPFTYALAFSRFAPVQCVFWGHPTTSGIPGHAIDYYVVMDAAEGDRGYSRYAEQLVRLDTLGAFYFSNESGQYRPSKSREAYAAEVDLPSEGHVYAIPQHCLKFHPMFDEALVKILALDRDAILVVKNCSTSIRVEERLAKRVDISGRIVRVPQLSLQDYVRLFGGSHVALETFPFGGSITSLDAFEGGTPVVSLAQFRARPALTVALYDIMNISCCVASNVDCVERPCASRRILHSGRRSARRSARRFRLKSMDAALEIEALLQVLGCRSLSSKAHSDAPYESARKAKAPSPSTPAATAGTFTPLPSSSRSFFFEGAFRVSRLP